VFYDSFGARQILSWGVSGELFDRGRFPVISILVAVGLLRCLWRWRRDERARAVVAVGLLSLLLFFGRSTLGDALRLLPGSGDLFLRRYVFGVHLAGLYLAGFAMAWIGRLLVARVRRRVPRVEVVLAALVVLAILLLAPAWTERGGWAATGATWIVEQQQVEDTEGVHIAELVAIAEQRGTGRIYAGMRSNWGNRYQIGQVPVYAELLNLDAQAVGFTRPTWSLSSPAEYRFRDTDPAHWDVFDVRYLIQPSDRQPLVDAELIAERGAHGLWEVAGDGSVEVVDVSAPIVADRIDLGRKIAPWLSSTEPESDVHPGISFGDFEAAEPTLSEGSVPDEPPGQVLASEVALDEGRASATVDLERTGAVILKASFDNRWRVTVDGREMPAQMFAQSLVGRVLPPGRHEIAFEYAPFPRYDLLLLVGAATFGLLFLLDHRRRQAAVTPGREDRVTQEPAGRR
jgi:hypothetical protein